MRTIIPEGMVVFQKINQNIGTFKLKSLVGFVRAFSEDINLQTNVHQNTYRHYVLVSMKLTCSFECSCGTCDKHYMDWNSCLVMN
jgi:hypothetical protein